MELRWVVKIFDSHGVGVLQTDRLFFYTWVPCLQNLSVEFDMNVTILQDPSVGAVQPQPDPNQYGGYYGYTHGYETYGYAPPAQDPNMYYGYSGYGNYQQPQQQQPQQVQYS